MLIMNGYRDSYIPITFAGDALYGTTQTRWLRPADQLAIFIGEGGFSDLTAMTDGNYPPKCFQMAKKAGALSANNRVFGEAVCVMNLVAGRALSGSVTGGTTTSATGRTIAFGSGTAAGSVTLYAALNAQAFMTGTAEGEATTTATGTEADCAMAGTASGTCTVTGEKNALAQCVGTASGSCTATMTSYATGSLVGHIYCNDGDASIAQMVDGVWTYLITDSTTAEDALLAAGSAGDPWITTLPGAYTGNQAGSILTKIKKGADLIPALL
jgi:hypothetical protein